MIFYFVRHGETDSNARGMLSGSIDSPLNELGHEQAEAMARRMAVLEVKPAKIFVSGMRRTRETAAYLRASLQLEPQIVSDFREWDMGEWQEKPYSDVRHLILGDGEPKEGETRKAFHARVERAWRETHSPEPYMIVSHGGVLMALQDLLQVQRFKSTNCEIIEFRHEFGSWKGRIV